MTVNVENMRTFVAALRSGDFEQGYGKLRTTDVDGNHKHCCLGVATQKAIDAGVINETGWKETLNGPDAVWDNHGWMPSEVAMWLGVGMNPDISEGLSATIANDIEHCTFLQIADGFEATYLAPSTEGATT